LLPTPGPGSKLPGGGSWNFSYDGVDRLTQAQGNQTLAPNKVTSYTQTYTFDSIHNTKTKKRVHGITTNGGNTHNPPKTNIDFAYQFNGPRPHAPTSVGDSTLNYDPSGNLISFTKQGTGARRDLIWDDDNRLIEAIHAGAKVTNLYDAGGNRIVKKGQHGTTLFVSNFFQLRNTNDATKHIFAGAMRVASVILKFKPQDAPATTGATTGTTGTTTAPCNAQNNGNAQGNANGNCNGAANVNGNGNGAANGNGNGNGNGNAAPSTAKRTFFFHSDHLGSTNLLTTQDGGLHEHLEYFPDGEVWIESASNQPVNGFTFSGKFFDPETGFYDFGQRFYDPSTGLWLGVDPAVSENPSELAGKPMASSLYGYANHNPITFVDPDGRSSWCGQATCPTPAPTPVPSPTPAPLPVPTPKSIRTTITDTAEGVGRGIANTANGIVTLGSNLYNDPFGTLYDVSVAKITAPFEAAAGVYEAAAEAYESGGGVLGALSSGGKSLLPGSVEEATEMLVKLVATKAVTKTAKKTVAPAKTKKESTTPKREKYPPGVVEELEKENRAKNQGKLKCEKCGNEMVQPQRSFYVGENKGVPPNMKTVDHKTPWSAGGTNDKENLDLKCFSCNNELRDKK
jgi:RHS repeat-associated protein